MPLFVGSDSVRNSAYSQGQLFFGICRGGFDIRPFVSGAYGMLPYKLRSRRRQFTSSVARIQHIFDKNSISLFQICNQDVSELAYLFSVLDDTEPTRVCSSRDNTFLQFFDCIDAFNLKNVVLYRFTNEFYCSKK